VTRLTDELDEPESHRMKRSRGKSSRSTLLVASGASALGALPVWLVGSLGVFMGVELGFAESRQGIAISSYFAAASVASFFAGFLVERIGSRRSVQIAILMGSSSLLAIGFAATAWWHLIPLLMVAGSASAIMQPATNLALARGIPPSQQGLAFGFKQSSIPAASLIAGLIVPVLGATLGWRSAFVITSVVLLFYVLLIRRLPGSDGSAGKAGWRDRWSSIRPSLLVITLGAGAGVAAATSMSAFTVIAGINRGLTPSQAGLVLSLGSFLAAATRIVIGWYVDQRKSPLLIRVAGLLGAGALGAAIVAFSERPLVFMLGIMLMFGAGWGWNGLFIYSVVRQYDDAPAVATGVSQIGVRAGGIVGPLVFGFIAETSGDLWAWLFVAAALLVGSALVLHGRGMIRKEREQRFT
jgi:MFS family permease